MPKVTIYTSSDGRVSIENLPAPDALDLVNEWRNGEQDVLTFQLDDVASSHIARDHIIRIDVDY